VRKSLAAQASTSGSSVAAESDTLGVVVRRRRLALRLTQAALADLAGVSVRTLRDIEHERVHRPRLAVTRALTRALDIEDGIWIGVLGPLLVHRGGLEQPVSSGRQRSLLGVLAVQPNVVVSRDEVVDLLWAGHPPTSYLSALHSYVTRLRRVVPTISSSRVGYRLETDAAQLDVLRFSELETPAGTRAAFSRLAEALRCWRGPVLADVDERLRCHPAALALSQRRVAAAERLAELGVHLGVSGQAVDLVQAVVRDEPLHEGLHAKLMLALAAAGEQSAALALFAELRTRLREELGVPPSTEVDQAHLRVLRQDVPVPPVVVPPAGRLVPAQLPLDVRGFTGRRRELAWLDRRLSTVLGVFGTAGVGKSALVVHWAHQICGRYPDGQLYVNLRGFDPTGAVMNSANAVRMFLDALGVPPERIPATVDGQVGLYRSLLAGKRMLILLDNARDAEQIRPLLPGAPDCLVLVTSRNQLTSLVAVDGARSLTLGLMSTAEARQLLVHRVGKAPVAADPTAVAEVIQRCARLPLALVIAAARAMAQPDVSLAVMALELGEARGGLDALDGGDAVSDVRAVFSWSYQTLSAEAARLFRLLGLHPGPDVSLAAVASLVGEPVEQVRRLLDELTRAHLLAESALGRFAFHDLLRAYASELVRNQESDAEQRVVLHRLLDHYLFSAFNATVTLDTHRHRISLPTSAQGVGPETFARTEQALAWFVAEHQVLLAAVTRAGDTGFDSHVWQLAWTLATFFARHGHLRDWITTEQAALTAAQRAGTPADEARAHRGLASALGLDARYEDAYVHFRLAIDMFAATGDLVGEAHSRRLLVWTLNEQDRYAEALPHTERVCELFRVVGDPVQVAGATNVLGWFLAHVGEHQLALTKCQEAYAVFQDTGDRAGLASTADSLGYIHQHLGNRSLAISCYEQAIDVYREVSNRGAAAETLERLGDLHREDGDRHAARAAWLGALEIFNEVGRHVAERVAGKLDSLATYGDAR
jgi:DNA-binding SARP family transcriptional activator/tetratricopeptide (TPR) repeat protein